MSLFLTIDRDELSQSLLRGNVMDEGGIRFVQSDLAKGVPRIDQQIRQGRGKLLRILRIESLGGGWEQLYGRFVVVFRKNFWGKALALIRVIGILSNMRGLHISHWIMSLHLMFLLIIITVLIFFCSCVQILKGRAFLIANLFDYLYWWIINPSFQSVTTLCVLIMFITNHFHFSEFIHQRVLFSALINASIYPFL